MLTLLVNSTAISEDGWGRFFLTLARPKQVFLNCLTNNPPFSLIMTKFSFALLASLVLAGCGSGGGGGNDQTFSTTLTGPFIPPSQRTPITTDTAIISTLHARTASGSRTVGVDCVGLTCTSDAGITLNLSNRTSSDDYAQRNGRVNGPHIESGVVTQNGISSDNTVYSYWMGDAAFAVVREVVFANGIQTSFYYGQVAGDNTGSKPRGNATYSGRAIAVAVNNDFDGYRTGDVDYGDFYATYNFGNSTIEMDIEFDDWSTNFIPTRVASNGSFSRVTTDGGELKGNFFGANHNEVSGVYDLPSQGVVGAFGGIKD